MTRGAQIEGSKRVTIIGAGVAGLATAALLAADGHQVTVFERSADVGGRAGQWEQEGFRFDTGPSWWLMTDCFEHFFRMLGSRLEDHVDLVRLDPAYRVFGEKYSTPLDLRGCREDSVGVFESQEVGAGRALAAYLDSAREAYELATSSFLYTTFTSISARTIRSIVSRPGTLARLLLESLYHRAARTVTDTRLRQVLGYPAVFLGTTPRSAPSIYHLMSSIDLEQGVLYPQGGFTRLVTALQDLAELHGADIRTDTEVTAIRTAPRGQGRRPRVAGVRTRPTDGASAGAPDVGVDSADADVVVSAADLHHTETALLPREAQSYPQSYWDRRVSGPGAVLVMLGVRGSLPAMVHHNLLFTEDWDENFAKIHSGAPGVPDPASIYVCKPSATDPDVAPPGCENLFLLIPVSPDSSEGESLGRGGVDRAGDRRIEAAADRAINQVARWTGTPDLAERVVVRRTVGPKDFAADFHSWRGNALGPAHTLRQSAFLRGSQYSRRVKGLLYAGGTTLPGVGLPMCLISAENILKMMRGDRSDSPSPEPTHRHGPATGPLRRNEDHR